MLCSAEHGVLPAYEKQTTCTDKNTVVFSLRVTEYETVSTYEYEKAYVICRLFHIHK